MTVSSTTRLELTRRLQASPEKVYTAWTRPEKMRLWFAPGHLTTPSVETDLRPGGRYRIEMHDAKEGATHVVVGTYRELSPYDRLVFTWGWEGDPSPETLVTVELRPVGQETELVLVHERLASEESRDKHLQGWIGCLDKLVEHIERIAVSKQIDCKDLGCCDHVITAPDDAQLKERLYAHAQEFHPDAVKAMTPELAAAMDETIRQVTVTI